MVFDKFILPCIEWLPFIRSNKIQVNYSMRLHLFIIVFVMCAIWSCSDDETPAVAIGIGEVESFGTYRAAEVGWASSDGKVMSGTLQLPRFPGEYPAVIFHFGSGIWSRQDIGGSFIKRWVDEGFAVLTYDKRGVRRSQGECCPWSDPDYFPLLGDDVLEGLRIISQYPEIRSEALGTYGFSQGGWVLPVTAARSNGLVAFTVIGSGPTVTLGEELLYSELTGENDCEESGLSMEEIAQQLAAEGPSLFDPLPYLQQMTTPGLWVYGENDLSVPVTQCIEILDSLVANGKQFEYLTIPNANHSWIINGGICQTLGNDHADPFPEIFNWIDSMIN